ncbi:AraC family transcriptional regulator [Haloferula sp. BvORR071]|uniref:AraC family transcriptional regulator n=1 Tax=Haloferula sp. BvORR071 TaxID=1396141 RepID=UPI000553156C|nr:AraC family transcriptional regulator [Haloferula sp. BvORR071]
MPTSSTAEAEIIRSHVVRGDEIDARDWILASPLCPLLAQHHIAHLGLLEMREPYEMSRPDQSGTFMLACLSGSGLVKVDGQWKRVAAGHACLLPPFVSNAMKATGKEPWLMCWVRYRESRESNPIVSAASPVLGAYDPQPLLNAIQGLHAECKGDAAPAMLHLWTELIHSYVLRFAQPHQADARLWKLWEQVQNSLEYPWSLEELAHRACVCKEHLRRLCRNELGRSPMQQVTFLRMQQARHLLATTDEKVETITRQIGYTNPHTFSNTFKKWIGWRPSEQRR